MSKSMGNGVDLGEQLAAHGVDAIRLTMLFASPPEDDIDWADMSPDASVKFLGRVSRLAADAGGGEPRPRAGAVASGDIALRKVTHRTIDEVTRLVEGTPAERRRGPADGAGHRARRAIDSGPGAADPAVREAAETLAVLLSLFAPYTAEECWELLGHRAVGRDGRLAGRRSRAAGRGPGHLRRPGRTARSATGWRCRPASPPTSCASWPWPRPA